MAKAATPNEQYGVQMLRAVAALGVVVHHALEQSNGAATAFSPDWLTTSGAAGVDIFFVISGFIMLYTSFRPGRVPLTPESFLFRRATRIYPFYWACCLAMLALMLAGFLQHNRLAPPEIALSLALLPSAKLIIGVSWTLVYEVYFYAVFAATLLFRSPLVSTVGASIVLLAGWLAGQALGPSALATFLERPITFEFALGLWIALAFSRARRWPMSPLWMVPGFLLLMAAPVIVHHPNTNGLTGLSRFVAWGLPGALVVGASLSVSAAKSALARLLVQLGDASYALYLTHPFVMIGYGLLLRAKFVSHAPQTMTVPFVVLLAVAIGVVAHVAIEKPLLAFIRRRTRRERLVSEPAATG